MPVFPMTKTCSSLTASSTRLWLFPVVGARWNAAILAMSCRFSSSGNGVSVECVRSPASTCTTGMRRWNAARAAASADEVSPCTRAATGKPWPRIWSSVATVAPVAPKRSRQNASRRCTTDATRSFSVSPGRPTSRSTSGSIPARSRIGATRSRCWPVVTTTGVNQWLRRSAWTTGNILIASGRVPIRTMTLLGSSVRLVHRSSLIAVRLTRSRLGSRVGPLRLFPTGRSTMETARGCGHGIAASRASVLPGTCTADRGRNHGQTPHAP